MAKWVSIGSESDFPAGEQKAVNIEGIPIAVFNIEGAFMAIANVCPHAGLPLAGGELCGKVITCPFHGYAYNVQNGKNVDFPDNEPPVRTFPVRVTDGGQVEIDLEPCTSNA